MYRNGTDPRTTTAPASTSATNIPPINVENIIAQDAVMKQRAANNADVQRLIQSGVIKPQVQQNPGTIDYRASDRRSANYVGNPNLGFLGNRVGESPAFRRSREDAFNTETAAELIFAGAAGIATGIRTAKAAKTAAAYKQELSQFVDPKILDALENEGKNLKDLGVSDFTKKHDQMVADVYGEHGPSIISDAQKHFLETGQKQPIASAYSMPDASLQEVLDARDMAQWKAAGKEGLTDEMASTYAERQLGKQFSEERLAREVAKNEANLADYQRRVAALDPKGPVQVSEGVFRPFKVDKIPRSERIDPWNPDLGELSGSPAHQIQVEQAINRNRLIRKAEDKIAGSGEAMGLDIPLNSSIDAGEEALRGYTDPKADLLHDIFGDGTKKRPSFDFRSKDYIYDPAKTFPVSLNKYGGTREDGLPKYKYGSEPDPYTTWAPDLGEDAGQGIKAGDTGNNKWMKNAGNAALAVGTSIISSFTDSKAEMEAFQKAKRGNFNYNLFNAKRQADMLDDSRYRSDYTYGTPTYKMGGELPKYQIGGQDYSGQWNTTVQEENPYTYTPEVNNISSPQLQSEQIAEGVDQTVEVGLAQAIPALGAAFMARDVIQQDILGQKSGRLKDGEEVKYYATKEDAAKGSITTAHHTQAIDHAKKGDWGRATLTLFGGPIGIIADAVDNVNKSEKYNQEQKQLARERATSQGGTSDKNFMGHNQQSLRSVEGEIATPRGFQEKAAYDMSMAKYGGTMKDLYRKGGYLPRYRYGGMMATGGVSRNKANAELEKDEIIMRDGGPDELVVGATHEKGGVPEVLNEGDYVWSDHLTYKGRSMAQLYATAVKNGATPQEIDQLKMLQEKLAGRAGSAQQAKDMMAPPPVLVGKYGGSLPKYKRGTGELSGFKRWTNSGGHLPYIQAAAGIAGAITAATTKRDDVEIRKPVVVEADTISNDRFNPRAYLEENQRNYIKRFEAAQQKGYGTGLEASAQLAYNDKVAADNKVQAEANKINLAASINENTENAKNELEANKTNAAAWERYNVRLEEEDRAQDEFKRQRTQAIIDPLVTETRNIVQTDLGMREIGAIGEGAGTNERGAGFSEVLARQQIKAANPTISDEDLKKAVNKAEADYNEKHGLG